MRTKRRSLLARSLWLHGPRTLNWTEDMLPEVGDNGVLIETVAGAISIGSERAAYLATERRVSPPDYPRMTGYESYGRITSVGNHLPQQLIGEKVIAFYGHCTHAVLPIERVIFVPSRVPPPTALLAILTCDVAKGVRKLNIQPEERVLVTGAGAIGLLTVWLLQRYGVQTVHVLDIDEERCEKALSLGAVVATHPAEAQRWHDDFAVGIECSGADSAFQLLQAKMQSQGRICVLSDSHSDPLTLSPHFHTKELSIVGSSDGWDYDAHAVWFWSQVEKDNTLAKTLFDMTIPYTDLLKTFQQLANDSITPVKVLINYQVENW